MTFKQKAAVGSLLATVAACGGMEQRTNEELAAEIGRGIAQACPMAAPSDEQARALCAARLTDFKLLRDTMQEPFLWGGQRPGKGYRLSDSDTTRFNALVWRRMYLSLFMFTGDVRIESSGDFVVIHLPFRFRNEMDPGAYPYPFWHSKTKWDSWQLSPELILIMEGGKLTGALRSSDRPDEAERRAHYVDRTWSGQWQWKEAGQPMPYVSLYKFLFSPTNPHVEKLDTAYRSLESEMRESSCLVCHAPDNLGKTGVLEFFNYPNQALYSRHSIVWHLEANTMPPKENDFGLPLGLDAQERQRLLELAKAFEAAADEALAFEGEIKPWAPPPPKMMAMP
jgi:hypothetical protein